MSQAQHLAANTATASYRIPAITTDNGWTWTHRTITADITKDNPWTARFAASGQGIQIQHGPHAERLVQQYTIRTADGAVQAVSVYSDDHGKTW